MIEEPLGPFVLNTSAESWLCRSEAPDVRERLIAYLERLPVSVSAVTLPGLAFLGSGPLQRAAYVGAPDRALPVDVAIAAAFAELLAPVPDPPSPPTAFAAGR